MTCKKESPTWFRLDPMKFLTDNIVSAMNAVEFGATMRLLLHQWIDGYITDNITILARQCKLTLPEMQEAWPMLSEFFPELEPGKRANRFMASERGVVMAAFERQSKPAKKANDTRWAEHRAAKAEEELSDSDPILSDTDPTLIQDLRLKTKDKEQVLSTLAPSDKKPALVAGSQPAGTLPLVDGTDFTITKAQVAEWKDAFPAVDVLQQLREMKVWTQAHKDRRKTRRGIVKFVVAWLSREQDKGPTQGQNGAPANGTNQLSPTKQRANANRAALAEALVRRGINPSCLDRGSNAPALPEPRPDGQPGGILVGFRATGPEILPPESHSGPGGTQAHTGAELLSAAR